VAAKQQMARSCSPMLRRPPTEAALLLLVRYFGSNNVEDVLAIRYLRTEIRVLSRDAQICPQAVGRAA
jgi:hypothetical protein